MSDDFEILRKVFTSEPQKKPEPPSVSAPDEDKHFPLHSRGLGPVEFKIIDKIKFPGKKDTPDGKAR